MKGLTFNGIRKDWLYLLVGKQKSPYAPRQTNLIKVAGRPGAYPQGVETDVLVIRQPVGFMAKNGNEEQVILDDLKSWLLTGEDKPLQFDDEPGRTYYARLDGSMDDYEKFVNQRSGTLIFLCPDPYAYGTEQTVDRRVEQYVVNEGTAESYPIIKLEPSMDTSRLVIKNYSNMTPYGSAKQIVLGYPQSPMQEEVDPLELVMHDTMRSTASWQTATEIDNGFIAGEMGVNAHGFYADKFGGAIDMKRWQGPSLIKAIGQPLQDFMADILVRNINVGKNGTGMIEVYFRDANGNRVAKIGIEDLYTNSEEIQGKARIGTGNSYHDIYTKPDQPDGWNNFDGILRITREDDAWRPYFAKIINGKHNWVRGNLKYVDVDERATAPITHVQVAIRKFPAPAETDMAIKEIKMYKINQITDHDTQVPMSFKQGDQVEIDCGNGLVLVNGEQRNDLIDLQTDFFSLVPGLNNVDGNFPFTTTWTNRYL